MDRAGRALEDSSRQLGSGAIQRGRRQQWQNPGGTVWQMLASGVGAAVRSPPALMSRGATLQRRTTYLISLTLVKLESVQQQQQEEDEKVGVGDGVPQPYDRGGSGSGSSRDGQCQTPSPPAADLARLKSCKEAEEAAKLKRQERIFHRQDALWISTSSASTPDYLLQLSPSSPGTPGPSPSPNGSGRAGSLWASPSGSSSGSSSSSPWDPKAGAGTGPKAKTSMSPEAPAAGPKHEALRPSVAPALPPKPEPMVPLVPPAVPPQA
ncbi:hypothetical protein lerEdw1_004088 [Lerista edwardsae]|nr:hypothetical protein lerEdw1_004088 [Lerista edwardsae]